MWASCRERSDHTVTEFTGSVCHAEFAVHLMCQRNST